MLNKHVIFSLIMICGLTYPLPIVDGDIDNDYHIDVKTNNGVVRGFKAKDGEYVTFFGIPYAAPPVGSNRFKTPLPPISWNETFEATKIVKCPQRGTGDEDCLVVNVFTPLETKKLLPVLVFFHGGSFIIGSGYTTGMNPLIEKNVIVVTVNYRLGVLGFLCLGIEEAPGNAGLKDQVAALKWINKNIKQFGGDPNKITIYGMSAGSASVELLLFSNTTKGLFNKAILESASALSVFSTALQPVDDALSLGAALNFPEVKDLKELSSYYQSVSHDILSTINYEYYINNTNGNFGFVPCIEKHLGVESFITDTPLNIFTKGEYNKVPLMFAYTTLEGLFLRSEEFYIENFEQKMNDNFSNFIPYDLEFNSNEIKDLVAEKIKEFYFGKEIISKETLLGYLNFFGDYFVLYPIIKSILLHAKQIEEPIYLVEFAYKGNMGSKEEFYENITFAGHGDFVKHAMLINPVQSEEDKIAVNRVSTIISNFVKFGNPLPTPTALLNVTWPRVQPQNLSYLHVCTDTKVLEDPYLDRIIFWDDLYEKFRRPIIGFEST